MLLRAYYAFIPMLGINLRKREAMFRWPIIRAFTGIDSESRARAVHSRVALIASVLMVWAILLVCSLTSRNYIVGLGWAWCGSTVLWMPVGADHGTKRSDWVGMAYWLPGITLPIIVLATWAFSVFLVH